MYSRFSGACFLINLFLSDPATYRAPGVKYEKENGSRVRCWYICLRNSDGGRCSKVKHCVWDRRVQGGQPVLRCCSSRGSETAKLSKWEQWKIWFPYPALALLPIIHPPNPNKSTWRLKIGDERSETDADRSVTLGTLGNQVVWWAPQWSEFIMYTAFPVGRDTIPNQPS